MSRSDNTSHTPTINPGRPRIVLFSLFAFCVLAVSVTFFGLSIGRPYMGAQLVRDKQGWRVEEIDANGLASEAGIREGDTPIEINGQPAQAFLEKYNRAGTVYGMLIKELTVINDRGQFRSVTLEGKPPTWASLIELIAWFVVCLVFWVIGFCIFFKRSKSVAALLLCLFGLTFGLALSANMAAERATSMALWLEVVATVICPWLLLHFFLVLPEERAWLRTKPLVYFIYVPAVITLVLFPLFGYANGQSLPWFRTIRLFEYSAAFLATVGVAIYNYSAAVSVRTRQQMKIVLIGCLAALVPFLVLSVLPEAIWEQAILPCWFSILLVIFIPVGMGYAVVTQGLMDIDLVIRRSIIYGLITISMALILSTGILLSVVFEESLGVPEEILIALGLGGVATTLFGPTKSGIEILVDRLFYKDRYDYRQIIQSLSTSLNSLRDLNEISRFIVGTIVHTLNLAGGCLFIRARPGSYLVSAVQGTFSESGKQEQLVNLISRRSRLTEFPNSASSVDSDVGFLIPLVVGEKEVGILCLSPKTSRQDFSSDDVFLLQGLASVAAAALRSAALVQDVSARDAFVSIASHELRTPLTSIMGYAELLLLRDPPDATRKRWVANIFESSRKVSAMVDDLLNVSRIRSGKLSINLEKVKLSDVLTETLSMAEESTSKHEFVVNIERDLPEVVVDEAKFSQVVGNLLSNAIKYSPDGGRVALSARNDLERHRVVVQVTDEGIGISPADRDSLFTTFHRIHRPETQGIRGSGLGLYIAKEWTEAMGGEIWLESELDKGSTFFLGIPTQNSDGTV